MRTKRTTTAAAAVICAAATLTMTACSSNSGGGHTTSAPAPTQTTGGPNDPNWARGTTALNGFLALGPSKTLPAEASTYATPSMISNTNLTNRRLWDSTSDGGPIVRATGTSKVADWKPVKLNLDGPAAPAGNPWHMSFRACIVSTGGLYNKAGKLVSASPPGGLVASISAVSGDSGKHWKISSINYADKAKAPGGDPKCGTGTASSSSKSSAHKATKKQAKKTEHKK